MPHLSPRPVLYELAERFGIMSEYVDQTGTTVRTTSDDTREALLAAMGVDASSAERARAALAELDACEAEQLLSPVRVVRDRQPDRRRLAVRLPDAWRDAPLDWSLEVREEGGAVHHASGALRRRSARNALLPLPATLPLGYHTARVRIGGPRGERAADQLLVVAPDACPAPAELLGERRVFGIIANVYTVRSERNWGAGDFTDLRELAVWSAGVGAEFVGVNPLHALRNRGAGISPYSPVSRLFRNVLYLDVEAIPELADSAEAHDMLGGRTTLDELRSRRASDRVEYARVMALKRPVLEMLHHTFVRAHQSSGDARGTAYARYVQRQGDALTTFATFMALDDHFRNGATIGASSWHDWPVSFRDPRSPDVAAFRESHRDEVDFHRWLQFELDRQLAEAAGAGARAGLAVGLYQDLAIGTASGGSDTWAFPHLFATGACIGAPPDAYAPQGQNWALPPLDPHRLRHDGYRYWTLLLRSALDHAGALRIDHVLGLFRQFWIPDGMPGSAGAYVRFPADDLLGIVALESTRHRALVAGEDLGSVPPEVPRTLRRWNILSSRVLYFERDRRGGFRPAARYAPLALATANTHDLVPIAGFWRGSDIELRRQAGLIPTDEAADAARAERSRERKRLLRRLVADGALLPARAPSDGGDDGDGNGAALRGAVHDFLCRTPAVLVGLSLDDLVGETEPVNLPGVGLDAYPSWSRRLRLSLEALRDDPGVAAALRCQRASES
jgi:4-alpha-glucanotransferase